MGSVTLEIHITHPYFDGLHHLTVYWFIDKSFDFRCWPFRWISRSHATWMQRSTTEFDCTVFSFSCHGSGSQRQGSQKYLVLHLRSHVRTDDRPSVTYCKTAATSQRLTRNFSSSSSSSSVSYIHNSRLLMMMRIPSRWLCWYEVCSAWVTCCAPPIWFAGLVRSFHSHILKKIVGDDRKRRSCQIVNSWRRIHCIPSPTCT